MPTPPQPPRPARTEREVVEQVQQALLAHRALDPALQAELNDVIARCEPKVRAVCRRLVSHEEAARELAQEALTQAWRKLPEFEYRDSLGPWLCQIARNLCLNHNRKRSTTSEDLSLAAEPFDPDDPARSALQHLTRQERVHVWEEAMESLRPADRFAVRLRFFKGLDNDAIARALRDEFEVDDEMRVVWQRVKRSLGPAMRRHLAGRGHSTSLLRTAP